MFCDACGTQLEPVQKYCTRCGKAVIGPAPGGSGRVARHVHPLGILWMVYSALVAFGGVLAIVVAQTVFRHGFTMGPGFPQAPPPPVPLFVPPLIQIVGVALLVKGGLGLVAGIGLLQRESWARVLAIVVGIIGLLSVPFGTALGIYTLWVLLGAGSDAEYKALAAGA